MNTSYSFIPHNLQIRLMEIRDSLTLKSWELGDIANEAIAHADKNDLPILRDDIYKAVASFVGKQGRTVREYALVASTYPPQHREHFSVLAFDYFRVAARLANYDLSAACEILTWAEAQVDQLNRPATVDALVAKFGYPTQVVDDSSTEPDSSETGEDEPSEAATHAQGRQVRTAFHIIRETILQSHLDQSTVDTAIDYLGWLENTVQRALTTA